MQALDGRAPVANRVPGPRRHHDADPVFSPDGSKSSSGGSDPEAPTVRAVYVVNADGSGEPTQSPTAPASTRTRSSPRTAPRSPSRATGQNAAGTWTTRSGWSRRTAPRRRRELGAGTAGVGGRAPGLGSPLSAKTVSEQAFHDGGVGLTAALAHRLQPVADPGGPHGDARPSSCSRAPEPPSGWPSAIAPPLGFSAFSSDRRRRRRYSASQASGTDAKASLTSNAPISSRRKSAALPHLSGGRHRGGQHDHRVVGGQHGRVDTGQRPEAKLRSPFRGRHQQCCRAVGDLTRIPGGDHAVLGESRTQSRQRFQGAAAAYPLVHGPPSPAGQRRGYRHDLFRQQAGILRRSGLLVGGEAVFVQLRYGTAPSASPPSPRRRPGSE